MRVRVLAFGPLAETLGARELDVELPDRPRVADLLERLFATHPPLETWRGRLAVAVNREYAPADRALHPGDEVALLPPVSGGAGDGGAPGTAASAYRVVRAPIDPGAVLARVAAPDAGGTVVFVGTVRGVTGGRRTRFLDYEAYEPMAEAEMARIGREIAERWSGTRLAVEHRLGRLRVGEIAVVVAVSAPHRAEAFAACRHAVDQLKRRVPIWKKEWYEDGAVWVGRDGTHPHAVG